MHFLYMLLFQKGNLNGSGRVFTRYLRCDISLEILLVVLLWMSVSLYVYAQINVLEESFESWDHATSQVWSGDLNDFELFRDGSRSLLRLDSGPEPSRSQLRTQVNAAYGSWEFYFRKDFDASNLNRAFIFLISDREDLNYLDGSSVNGYAIRTGENGDTKRIRLVRFDNGIQQELMASNTIIEARTEYHVKITRNHDGEWQLFVAEGYGSTPAPAAGPVIDNKYDQSGYFGMLLRYTSANVDRFYFDDILITSELSPFKVESVTTVDPQTLRIHFNRQPDPESISSASFKFTNTAGSFQIEMFNTTTLSLNFADPFTGGPDKISVDGLYDKYGFPVETESTDILVALRAGPADLVINEIMFDPLSPTFDHPVEQSEYIEIYNRREYAVFIDGIHLKDHEEYSNLASITEPYNNGRYWVPGNGYLLLYPESVHTSFQSSRVARFFELSAEFEPFAILFQRSTLGLPLSGRKIVLSNSDNEVIDLVDYRPEWHNPNLIDTRGISLERVNPDISSNNPDNWSSNNTVKGGSPGSVNSLFQLPEQTHDDYGINLEPNPFSPSGVGSEKNLYVNYKLDEADFLVRVRIFDRYGRLVRNLADYHPAGYEGSLIWDGRTDQGQDNRIGIYIIVFEAFNSTTGRKRVYKKTAVLAKQF
jgi:hypothetical protein